MKFKFTKLPTKPTPAFPQQRSALTPLIPVRLCSIDNGGQHFDFKALLDSGAHVSIFPAECGKAVGLKIKNDRIQPIYGIGGQAITTYLHDVILEIGGWPFETVVCFTSDNIVFPVLGREGFFSLFEIKIDFSRETIELKPKQKPSK